jgi:hypothetical protein
MKISNEPLRIIMVLGILFLLLRTCDYLQSDQLKVNGYYTVGEVTGIKIGAKGKRHLMYKFKVDDSLWYGEYGKIGRAKKGHKYLVLYSKADHSLNIIYPDRPMDSLQLGTEVGRYWDSPLPIDSWEIIPVLNNSPN